MAKSSTITNDSLADALDLLSPSQIAALVFGGYTLFGDLRERAQPKPIDRLVSKQLRVVNADRLALKEALIQFAQHDPAKVLAVAAYLKGATHTLGARQMAGRLEEACRG